jgi:queuine/archaeosine tRNA-ribosyltransferase
MRKSSDDIRTSSGVNIPSRLIMEKRFTQLAREGNEAQYEIHKKKLAEGCRCASCRNTKRLPNGMIRCLWKNKYVLSDALCERHV